MLEALFEARHFELVRRLETTLTQVVGQPFSAQLSAVLTTFTDTDVKHVRLQRALLEEGGSRGPEHRREAREDVESSAQARRLPSRRRRPTRRTGPRVTSSRVWSVTSSGCW